MFNKQDKNKARQKRHLRVRNHISGTAERPRLNVFRSLSNIYAQVIDDVNGVTLASANTLQESVADGAKNNANIEAAKKVGAAIAKACADKGIETVVFDRNGYLYHGKVAALAEAAREAGLKF